MSEGQQFLLLLRTHLRMSRTKCRKLIAGSKLMSATLLIFLVTYSVTAYQLFRRGLIYFGQLPAAGGLLVDRMIHIVFFCFLGMLLFSVAVSAYIALYRSRETRWLLTLPISHRVLFLWKIFEASVFSSWGLLLISAPLLVAFAEQRGAGFGFYLRALLGILPFLGIAGSLAGILLLVTVRWMRRRHLVTVGAVCVVLFGVWIARTVWHERELSQQVGFSAALTFQQVLRHTDISANRALPSSWLASSLVAWSRPHRIQTDVLMPCLLISWSLMGAVTASWLSGRWFYTSWNLSLQNAAIAALRRRAPTVAESLRAIDRQFRGPSLAARLFGRPIAAVTRKDLLSFRREPAQWIQFLIVFGLLAIYAVGLRRLNSHIEQPRDLFLVACLNLAVCALALSTLTTRFVFPQFSLEGRRLWILARSPLRLPVLVLQKFALSTLFTSIAVSAIVLISGNTLDLPRADTLFFTGAMALMALGLNGMAVGFGVLFPNLEETNSAKIVSGFGGTLCLVASFVYIVGMLVLIAWSRFEVFKKNEFPETWFTTPNTAAGMAIAALLTFVLTAVPLIFAMRRLKRLEFLGSL